MKQSLMNMLNAKIAAGIILAGSLAAFGQSPGYPGLTVEQGLFMKGGHPFYGVGVNYFDVLIRRTGLEGRSAAGSALAYDQGFQTLREYEIPFIRFCAGGFYPKDWDLYLKNKEAYFKIFDQLVADAEKYGIGMIPSFFWNYATVPDLSGEPINQWGNPQSKTHEFMRQYTTEVVSRYKNSPAIWGWEFGNEYLLSADLPQPELGRGLIAPGFGTPSVRTERDKMFRKNVWIAYQAFVDTVRSLDARRPVFSGDAEPRNAAYHNWTEEAWRDDSLGEWTTIFTKDNQAMNTLSVHFYYHAGTNVSGSATVAGLGPDKKMAFMMEIAQRTGKPLFVGEFGPDGKEKTNEEERRQFEFLLELMVTNQVQMSAVWNFDFEHPNQIRWNITKDNHRAYMLEALRKANRMMHEEYAGRHRELETGMEFK
jgi:hypothetical protein